VGSAPPAPAITPDSGLNWYEVSTSGTEVITIAPLYPWPAHPTAPFVPCDPAYNNCYRSGMPLYNVEFHNPYGNHNLGSGASASWTDSSLDSYCQELFTEYTSQWLETAAITPYSTVAASTWTTITFGEYDSFDNYAGSLTAPAYTAYEYVPFSYSIPTQCCSSCTVKGGVDIRVYHVSILEHYFSLQFSPWGY